LTCIERTPAFVPLSPNHGVSAIYLYVFDAVDGDTGHTNIAHHTLIVRVIAAVRRQIERYRQPLLASSNVAPVKRIALFNSAETCDTEYVYSQT
jgi:hypothetical protein